MKDWTIFVASVFAIQATRGTTTGTQYYYYRITQLTHDSYCNRIDSFHDKYCTSSYYSRAIMTRCDMDAAKPCAARRQVLY